MIRGPVLDRALQAGDELDGELRVASVAQGGDALPSPWIVRIRSQVRVA